MAPLTRARSGREAVPNALMAEYYAQRASAGLIISEATGIRVDIEAESSLQIHDRLSAEILQMVTEGLSNVRRHSQSNRVAIHLTSGENHLRLRIENEGDGRSISEPFAPCSIKERAEALGGSVSVELGAEGRTIVLVEIPL